MSKIEPGSVVAGRFDFAIELNASGSSETRLGGVLRGVVGFDFFYARKRLELQVEEIVGDGVVREPLDAKEVGAGFSPDG